MTDSVKLDLLSTFVDVSVFHCYVLSIHHILIAIINLICLAINLYYGFDHRAALPYICPRTLSVNVFMRLEVPKPVIQIRPSVCEYADNDLTIHILGARYR